MAPWTLLSVDFKQTKDCLASLQLKVFTEKNVIGKFNFLYLSSYQACQEFPIFRSTKTVEQVPGSSCPRKISDPNWQTKSGVV